GSRTSRSEREVVPGEELVAVVGDEDDLLRAQAPAVAVGARFERDDHPGLERALRPGDDPRLLVQGQPEAVAGVVRVGAAAGLDDRAGGMVDLACRRTGPDGDLRGLERRSEERRVGKECRSGWP